MKICVLTVAPVPKEYYEPMTTQLQQLYGSVLRDDTEVVMRGMAAGPASAPEHLPDYRNEYSAMLLVNEVVKAALAAEKDGFDAVVVNCFDDPGVKQARAVVNIPVFGICEPSLHFVCQLGRSFAALVPDLPGQVGCVNQQILNHGLMSRLLNNGVRKECKPYTESQPEAADNPGIMANRLATQAEKLVREGADVILIACGGLADNCAKVGLNHIIVDGRQVPVVLPLIVALKHTEMMLDIQNAYGIPVPSQAHDGARLSSADKERIQQGYGVA